MSRRFLEIIGKQNIEAIIDSDPDKIGNYFYGVKIIGIETYLREYPNKFILVTAFFANMIYAKLNSLNIKHYCLLADLPPEFSAFEKRDNLKNRVLELIQNDTEYVIYGKTPYVFILNSWIKEKLGRTVDIIVPRTVNHSYYVSLKACCPTMNVLLETENSFLDKRYTILLADEENEGNTQLPENLNKLDMFSIAFTDDHFYSDELAKLLNTHSGESCFIVATGPSLEVSDLERLEEKKIDSFSMNYIYQIYEKTKWRPNYYVIEDASIFIDDELVKKLGSISKDYNFWPDLQDSFWKNNTLKKNIRYHSLRNYSNLKSGFRFSENPAEYIAFGATVTYACMQLAVGLGYKNIYLLGVDFGWANDNSSWHFYEEERLIDDGIHYDYASDFGLMARAFMAAKKYAREHDINIYNATRGGYLEIFERVDFDEAISNCSL